MNILELSEQEIVRRNNLQQLKEMGIDPYPAAEYPVNAWSTDIIKNFVDLPIIGKDEEGNDVREAATPDNSPVVSIAGRIMSKRIMGKAAFAELQDSKGRIQVYIQRDELSLSPTLPQGKGAKALCLNVSGTDNAFTNLLAGFSRLHLTELGKGHGLYLAMDVDTVEQRP